MSPWNTNYIDLVETLIESGFGKKSFGSLYQDSPNTCPNMTRLRFSDKYQNMVRSTISQSDIFINTLDWLMLICSFRLIFVYIALF